MKSPFSINWKDKDAVIAYAKELGKGMTVYKHPQRNNFNIIHTSNFGKYDPSWRVFQT